MTRRTLAGWMGSGAIVVLLMAAPFFLSSSMVFRLGAAATAALLALSFNLLFHSLGLVSFGHAGFFAIGGYGIGILMQRGLSWPVALLAAVVLGGVVGVLFGSFALRISGIFFSILTLAATEIVHIVAMQWTSVTGGENGLYGVAAGTVLGLDLDNSITYYWVLIVLVALGALALKLVRYSRMGRTFRAIREDATRAEYLGVPVHRYRVTAFTISASAATFAGALYAPLIGLMAPADAGWQRSAEPLLSTLIGGSAAFLGPALGAALFALIEFALADLSSVRSILTGLILLAVIFVAPGGITGSLRRLRPTGARRGRETDATSDPATSDSTPGGRR